MEEEKPYEISATCSGSEMLSIIRQIWQDIEIDKTYNLIIKEVDE